MEIAQFDSVGNDLNQYCTPDWFRDAKFGIFIHWGIYSVPAYGDEWYGHWMYVPGSKSWAGDNIYDYNQMTHPGKGYKDFIPAFRGEHFSAEGWAELFRQAGAKYVMPVAMHHDSFALYDSALTPFKSTTMGPMRDVTAELSSAVRSRGMHFGVSQHFAENWWFFPHLEGLDTSDPAYAMLYGKENNITEEHLQRWYDIAVEMIDRFDPDLLYFDFEIAKPEFLEKRRALAAYYYNKQAERGKGVVLNYKYGAFEDGEAVLEVERGQLAGIRELPWQVCTSLGNKSWGYVTNEEYKTSDYLVSTLIDIVSKNGCLLLNVGPMADGTIPKEQQELLRQMGKWLSVYGEAIYGTRPWKVFGEGPTAVGGDALTEGNNTTFTEQDIRFTASKDGKALYAITLAAPTKGKMEILSLRRGAFDHGTITAVYLVGGGKLAWSQSDEALTVQLPIGARPGSPFAVRFDLV